MKKIMLMLTGIFFALAIHAADVKTEISELMNAQAAAWNRGDVRAFMSYYWHDDKLRFGSGNTITYGFDATQKRFLERYNTPEKMGELRYDILDVKVFDNVHAQVFGRWKLVRQHDNPNGLLTLNLEKRDGKWQIVSDHTSAE